jgi:hypothetical protein
MLRWLLKLQQANDLALPLVALLQNSGRQKPRHCRWWHYFKTPAGKRLGIAAGGITSTLWQAKDSALPLAALLQNSGRQKARYCIPWDAAVITKTPAGKWLSIAPGGITSKLRQAKDSAFPLAALLQNSGRQKTRHCRWRHYFKTPAGKRLGTSCRWQHYFKTPAGKRLGIASLEMLWWLLTLQQANDLALPLVALLQNSGRQKTQHSPWRRYFKTLAGKRLGIATQNSSRQMTQHCRWRHYFKTPAGKRLGIATGGITSKLRQAKDSALPLVATGGITSKLRQAKDSALPLAALLQNSGRQKTNLAGMQQVGIQTLGNWLICVKKVQCF